MSSRSLEVPVLIVGGGPVGMTLAIDLAWRGINVVVAELRRRDEPPSVKCNHVSARSMEIYRRLGVAGPLRDTGLPYDYPNDVCFRTTMLGPELSRIRIPSRQDRFTAKNGPDTWWPTPEPPHRINQIFMEPVLLEFILENPRVTLLNRTEITSFRQYEDRVVATATDLDSGAEFEITSEYMVGCDGGSSAIRKLIGAQFHGDAVVQRVQSTYIRAPKLLGMQPDLPSWMTISMNPRRCGNTLAIDGRETWIVHNYLYEHETDFEKIDRDWALREILGVGQDFEYEILSKEDWIGRRLVADKLRDRRVFICGDAAHIWVPYAGYGMNAGIADAENLSWKLAARLDGWADDEILKSYEAERLPITSQVSYFAMDHAHSAIRQRSEIPDAVEWSGREGDEARAKLGEEAYQLNVRQYCCGGLNFGYYYEKSPIVAYDGEEPPAYDMYDFTQSTVPGCRVPHAWLDGDKSLYDRFGPNYTLIRRDSAADPEPLLRAAAARGVPMKAIDAPSLSNSDGYRHLLLIARSDLHVAWRGNVAPADPLEIVDLLRAATRQVAPKHKERAEGSAT